MNKKEFVREVSKRTDFKASDVAAVIDVIGDVVRDTVKAGDSVRPFDGMMVKGVWVEGRYGYSPATRETIFIPAHTKPKATFTYSFKNEVK